MTEHNPSIRLYVDQPLLTGSLITLEEARAHYLRHVMRCGEGDSIAVFNGTSGEWQAIVRLTGKRHVQLCIGKKISDPRSSPDLWFAFAMIKNKSDLVVEKAVELGVSQIHSLVTQHAVVKNVNREKLVTHAIEAAEQCERHDIPEIRTHTNLASFLGGFPRDRLLLYGDESGSGKKLPEVLASLQNKKLALLIGPEGGFSVDEHRILKSADFALAFGMGPRIMRADTAAVAALACIQSVVGDWDARPHFKGNE